MKNDPIRMLVVLATLSLIGIIGTQIFWLNRAIAQQDQVFNYNVQAALRNVTESLCEANGRDFPEVNPIKQISSNYFIVRTNDRIDLANLEYLISAEIKKRAISQEFEYGVYDCANDQMVYSENINLNDQTTSERMPLLKDDEYYFGVYFPHKSQDLLAGFDLFKFTTVLTLVVILFFGYALWVILRQKRLSEVQKDFINNVSHELKTPLATLTLATHTLRQKSSDMYDTYLQIIQTEVRRLQRNVEDILQASVIDSHHYKVDKSVIHLHTFIGKMIEELKQTYSVQMVQWKLLGTAEKPIISNAELLETIVRNLADNAVKYGGKNIHFMLSQYSKKTILSITDDGIGLAKVHHKKIFQKFYRVPETAYQHNQKGFGLGLQIVSSAVRKLKGKITVESEEGKGSIFKISLPNG